MAKPSFPYRRFNLPTGTLKNGRKGVRYPVRFEEYLPLALKDQVSGKGTRGKEVACLPEMMSMFACFQENEFNKSLCNQEMTKFQDCYTTYLTKLRQSREQGTDLKLVPNLKVNQLTSFQVNKLLKKYPQSKKK